MQKFFVSNKENGLTLEKYVKKVLSYAPMSFIYKLFRKKDIKVNGHWQKEKYLLKSGDEVSIYITDGQIEEFKNRIETYEPSDYIKPWIIYEDKNIIIINKPQGVLTQDDDTNAKSLTKMLREYLFFTHEFDPETDLAFAPSPAHRLDRNTSGLIIFGKNKVVLQELSGLLQDHKLIEKHYLALVKGVLDEEGIIDVPLKKNEAMNRVFVSTLEEGGKPSKTLYKPLKCYDEVTLLDVKLLTGRTHQIRVHMAYIEHPIIGDSKYGDFALNASFKERFHLKNQFLHAHEIRFGKIIGELNYLSNKSFKADLCQEEQQVLNMLQER